jgi:hypothetical protein
VFNAEFFLQTFAIPSIALFKERNTLPVPHAAMAHTLMHPHIFTFLQTVEEASE